MKRTLYIKHFLLICTILLLIVLAWGAISGGVRQFPRSNTLGQQVQTIIQLAGGLLTLLTTVTCFWWQKWAAPIRAAWCVLFVLAAGLSALVWGPPMPLVALGFAAGALLIASATIWALRRLSINQVKYHSKPNEQSVQDVE